MTGSRDPIGPNTDTRWIDSDAHSKWLMARAQDLFDFFRPSLLADGRVSLLDFDGKPFDSGAVELHTVTRLIHSFALGVPLGVEGARDIVDGGMDLLWSRFRDADHGGYLWSVNADGSVGDGTKLAYGHVFVLLAGSSALQIGHPDAKRLIDDVAGVIDAHYWEDGPGRLADEYTRDWQPFSDYRGMNANMHGVEAMLAAFEATGDGKWLDRAGRILDFFVGEIAAAHDWRIPEHYTADWQIDAGYSGNPMFRPKGSTPGHSFELGRLLLQHWDLSGRPEGNAPDHARALIERALDDAWQPEGGFAYTLEIGGGVDIPDRYWWPVTEAIGALAALQKVDPRPEEETWYRRSWEAAQTLFIDHDRGGWVCEVDRDGRPTEAQFPGKGDIYHALQACLFPMLPGISRPFDDLKPL